MATVAATTSELHTFSDGSVLRLMSAKELIMIPIWRGNRSVNEEHVRNIAAQVGHNLRLLESTPFRLIAYMVPDSEGHPVLASFLIDGQHRACVMRRAFQESMCEPDFLVSVIVKRVESELDAIRYFKAINHVKAVVHDDYKVVVNEYMAELCSAFNVGKKPFIKPGGVKRPNLSADKLREVLEAQKDRLSLEKSDILAFVERVKRWNKERCEAVRLEMALGCTRKDGKVLESCVACEFMLAADPKLPWVAPTLMP